VGVGCAFGVPDDTVTSAGGDEIVDDLVARSNGIQGVLVKLTSLRALEAPVTVSPEANVEVGVSGVGDVIDENGRVETHDATGKSAGAIFVQVDRSEGTIGATTFTNHGFTAPTPAVRVEVVFLGAVFAFYFNKVGCVHDIPLVINWISEYGPLVTPVGEVFNGSRPGSDVGPAVASEPDIVRADDVNTVFARLVRVFKDAGFSVRQVFPQGQVGVASFLMNVGCLVGCRWFGRIQHVAANQE